MFLDGLALGGYRSFGEVQQMGPFAKINLFIGMNNSGKSNILRFLHLHLGQFGQPDPKPPFDKVLDRHQSVEAPFTVGIAASRTSDFVKRQVAGLHPKQLEMFERFVAHNLISRGTSCIWSVRTAPTMQYGLLPDDRPSNLIHRTDIAHNEVRVIWQHFRPGYSGGNLDDWVRDILARIDPFNRNLPRIDLIPAVRSPGAAGTEPSDLSGLGIIKHLNRLQHPQHHEQEERNKFDAINLFLQRVTSNNSCELEIPHTLDSITVKMDGKVLPLTSLGTGVHEVVIIAAGATVVSDQIVCIEEPELHLHPTLQRKLIAYLAEKTSNQYFITTHSAHFIDACEGAAVFHVRLEGVETRVTAASSSSEKADICRDLGYRPSDLVLANCVIWVEGPSDRIYLNHWIRSGASDLVEGVNYAIMFYGGRLLCHLSVDDPEVTEFISLCSLNRNLAIVIDSDKSNAVAEINATKRRIVDEFGKRSAFAWVTSGREIENYVPASVMRESVDAVREGAGERVQTGRYKRALPPANPTKPKGPVVDKLKVAHEVASRPADLKVLDLREKVEELVAFIRHANHQEHVATG